MHGKCTFRFEIRVITVFYGGELCFEIFFFLEGAAKLHFLFLNEFCFPCLLRVFFLGAIIHMDKIDTVQCSPS